LIGFFISLIIQLTIKEPVRGALQNENDQKNKTSSSSFDMKDKIELENSSSSKEENEIENGGKEDQEDRIMSSCGSSFVCFFSSFFYYNFLSFSLCIVGSKIKIKQSTHEFDDEELQKTATYEKQDTNISTIKRRKEEEKEDQKSIKKEEEEEVALPFWDSIQEIVSDNVMMMILFGLFVVFIDLFSLLIFSILHLFSFFNLFVIMK